MAAPEEVTERLMPSKNYKTAVARASARKRNRRWQKRNPEKHAAQQRVWRRKNWKRVMIITVKANAKRKNVPFNLKTADLIIPKICPILGISLCQSGVRTKPNSPNIDRIRPELGYVRGNIAIISRRANSLKNNATPDEIFRLAKWIQEVTCGN